MSEAADQKSSDRALPERGEVIAGKYEIEEVLGSGGMGVVVAARHIQLGKKVAIKFLQGDVVDDETVLARFLREARTVVELQSEHAARVTDVGTLDNGAPYMIMEYLRGIDLEKVLEDSGVLAIDEAIDYVLQASVAVAEAHSRGLVHRDLKPGNLFLTSSVDGEPLIKVLDFGIAKGPPELSKGQQNLTTTGMALGTPMFMSPEQLRDAKNADQRSDIWALGAVLYQLITDCAPFEADTLPALCAMISADPPTPLRPLRPDVSVELEKVIFRCLEKPPDARYQDLAQLARALEPLAAPRSEAHIERIVRIVDGRSSLLSPLELGEDREGLNPTVASTGSGKTSPVASEQTSSDDSAPSSDPTAAPAATGGSSGLGQTAEAWQATQKPAQPTTRLVIAGAMVALVVLLLLLWAPWSSPTSAAGPGESSASGAETAGGDTTSAETAPEGSTTTPARDAEAAATDTASAAPSTTSSAPEPSAKQPSSQPPKTTPRPTPTRPPAGRPTAPKSNHDLLDDRK